jgi:hypothetical protein
VERTTIAGETEVLGENLPQRHFVPPQIPHDSVRFRTPDRSGGKPATNRLSYGAAKLTGYGKVIHKDYYRKGSVEKKKISGRESQGAWRQDELIGGKPPVVK